MTGTDVTRRGFTSMRPSRSYRVHSAVCPVSCGLSLFNHLDKGAGTGPALGFLVPGPVALGAPQTYLSTSVLPNFPAYLRERVSSSRLDLPSQNSQERGLGIFLWKITSLPSPVVLVLMELWECGAYELSGFLHQEAPPQASYLLEKEDRCSVSKG